MATAASTTPVEQVEPHPLARCRARYDAVFHDPHRALVEDGIGDHRSQRLPRSSIATVEVAAHPATALTRVRDGERAALRSHLSSFRRSSLRYEVWISMESTMAAGPDGVWRVSQLSKTEMDCGAANQAESDYQDRFRAANSWTLEGSELKLHGPEGMLTYKAG